MPEVVLDDVTLAYDVNGEGEPIVLVCGCGQPAVAWYLGIVPALTAAGYQVITFDNRGIAPSSSPPAPYSIDQMTADTIGLIDHLGFERVRVAGHSMGGWIAEMLAAQHPDRVRAAALMGSCNVATAWETANTRVQRDLALLDVELPNLFYACEVLHYLPNHELQDDDIVGGWLAMIGDQPPHANPGRLGQFEACLTWSLDPDPSRFWTKITVPCLVVAFEYDIDSPPARAREAAALIRGSEFVEIADSSHLGIVTHADAVATALIDFFAGTE